MEFDTWRQENQPSALKDTPSHWIAEHSEPNPFNDVLPKSAFAEKKIWAMGGGKGGVGKSMIMSNLAISLAQRGERVIAIDLDLGGANLHTTFGIEMPRQTMSDFFERRSQTLEGCISNTPIQNLEMISGAQDHLGIANLDYDKKVLLLNEIQKLEADYILIDLGAGTNNNTIDFFNFADLGILTMLPEPTSIENAYRFIKSVFYRKLMTAQHLSPIRNWIQIAMDSKNQEGLRTPGDLYRKVNQEHPDLALKLKDEIQRIRVHLIVNQARTQSDVDLGFSIKSVCKKYFGIQVDYVGYLDYDSAVWQAIRRKRPVLLEFPNSQLASNLERMSHYLSSQKGQSGETE